jgi:endoribonuclease Dicer
VQHANRERTTEKPEKTGGPDSPREHLNIYQLLKRQEIGLGDLSPRTYQIELFERAKAENTIAVLDTGLNYLIFISRREC